MDFVEKLTVLLCFYSLNQDDMLWSANQTT